jgi:hypothetical protein
MTWATGLEETSGGFGNVRRWGYCYPGGVTIHTCLKEMVLGGDRLQKDVVERVALDPLLDQFSHLLPWRSRK